MLRVILASIHAIRILYIDKLIGKVKTLPIFLCIFFIECSASFLYNEFIK